MSMPGLRELRLAIERENSTTIADLFRAITNVANGILEEFDLDSDKPFPSQSCFLGPDGKIFRLIEDLREFFGGKLPQDIAVPWDKFKELAGAELPEGDWPIYGWTFFGPIASHFVQMRNGIPSLTAEQIAELVKKYDYRYRSITAHLEYCEIAKELIPNFDVADLDHQEQLAAKLCRLIGLQPSEFDKLDPCERRNAVVEAVKVKSEGNDDKAAASQQAMEGDIMSGEARALAILASHPEWTDTKIANAAGVHRGSLYRYSRYRQAKDAIKQGRQERPRGEVDRDGNLDAWE